MGDEIVHPDRTVVDPEGVSPELAAAMQRRLDADPEFAAGYRRMGRMSAIVTMTPESIADLLDEPGEEG